MTLSVFFCSDIHIEHKPKDMDMMAFIDTIIGHEMVDVICLLGDIGAAYCGMDCSNNDEASKYYDFVSLMGKRCRRYLLLITGNHEYYCNDGTTMDNIDRYIKKHFEAQNHIRFLNNDVIVIDDVCFVGSTLWSHIPQAHSEVVTNHINDYRYIYKGYEQRLDADHVNWLVATNTEFIGRVVGSCCPDMKIVVLTHHCPTMVGTSHPRHTANPTTYAFANNFDEYLKNSRISYWLCGHTHYNFDLNFNGTRVMSNQFGYDLNGARTYNRNILLNI